MNHSSNQIVFTTTDLQTVYREWIEHICNVHDINPTGIARRIGASPSTISRQIKPGWTRRPQLDIIRGIANEFGEQVPEALVGSQSKVEDVGPEITEILGTTDKSIPSAQIQVTVVSPFVV